MSRYRETGWWRGGAFVGVLVLLVAASVTLQVVRDRRYSQYQAETRLLYVPSGEVLQRLALSFDALLADVYWIRAVNHYGSTKLSEEADKQYDLLHPLLDITTTLDPRFRIAYRFGAIFLTEAYPNGPGRPDQAVALLQKGARQMPEQWEYLQDIGFVYYWWLHDYEEAAAWFRRASEVPGAAWWLKSLAANMLAEGGNRTSSRLLWQQIYETAENDWIRDDAQRRLVQLRALDEIDQLNAIVREFMRRTGRVPAVWRDLVAAGLLQQEPVDPTGTPYRLELRTGEVDVSPSSPLFPLPAEPPAMP